MNLKTKNGTLIKFNNITVINEYINKLKGIANDNPTKNINKLSSLLSSETFLSLFTEGEISSRKDIKKIFSDKKVNIDQQPLMIKNFLLGFKFVIDKREFSISNVYTLYNLLSKDVIDKEDQLIDGDMIRDKDVYISSNKLVGDFKGFGPKDIKQALNDLFDFLKDDTFNIYLRSIVGHIYFEMIHPFYDYNGRVGRFIPLWLFNNEGRMNEMLYFATAMGNYRDQYLSLFRKNINHKTYEVNIDKITLKILELLILNQYQYIWLKKQENKYIEVTKKSFTSFQKDFLWLLMKKSEISKNENSWFKINKQDKDFIELNLRPATMSVDTTMLAKANIIQSTNEKPKKYKLNNYKLINYDKL